MFEHAIDVVDGTSLACTKLRSESENPKEDDLQRFGLYIIYIYISEIIWIVKYVRYVRYILYTYFIA